MENDEVVLEFHLIFLNLQGGIEEKHTNSRSQCQISKCNRDLPSESSSADQTSIWHSHHHNVPQLLCRVVLDSFFIHTYIKSMEIKGHQ